MFSSWLLTVVLVGGCGVLAAPRPDDVHHCCTKVQIDNGGLALQFQSRRIGAYVLTGLEADKPIYKHEERDEYVFYLMSKYKGVWMVGPKPGHYNGGLAHIGDSMCVENAAPRQWKFTNGTLWQVDELLTVSCYKDRSGDSQPHGGIQCLYQESVEYVGGDLPVEFGGGGLVTTGNSSAECIKECEKRPMCKYWSWSRSEPVGKKNCFLKMDMGEPNLHKDFVSGSDPAPCADKFDMIGKAGGADEGKDITEHYDEIAASPEESSDVVGNDLDGQGVEVRKDHDADHDENAVHKEEAASQQTQKTDAGKMGSEMANEDANSKDFSANSDGDKAKSAETEAATEAVENDESAEAKEGAIKAVTAEAVTTLTNPDEVEEHGAADVDQEEIVEINTDSPSNDTDADVHGEVDHSDKNMDETEASSGDEADKEIEGTPEEVHEDSHEMQKAEGTVDGGDEDEKALGPEAHHDEEVRSSVEDENKEEDKGEAEEQEAISEDNDENDEGSLDDEGDSDENAQAADHQEADETETTTTAELANSTDVEGHEPENHDEGHQGDDVEEKEASEHDEVHLEEHGNDDNETVTEIPGHEEVNGDDADHDEITGNETDQDDAGDEGAANEETSNDETADEEPVKEEVAHEDSADVGASEKESADEKLPDDEAADEATADDNAVNEGKASNSTVQGDISSK